MLLGIVTLYKTAGSLFEAIAFTAELNEDAAMHETIEDGGGQCGVAEILVPVVDDAIGSNEIAAPKFVASVQMDCNSSALSRAMRRARNRSSSTSRSASMTGLKSLRLVSGEACTRLISSSSASVYTTRSPERTAA